MKTIKQWQQWVNKILLNGNEHHLSIELFKLEIRAEKSEHALKEILLRPNKELYQIWENISTNRSIPLKPINTYNLTLDKCICITIKCNKKKCKGKCGCDYCFWMHHSWGKK